MNEKSVAKASFGSVEASDAERGRQSERQARALAQRGQLERFAQTPCPLGLSSTVYSVLWPAAQEVIEKAFREDAPALLAAHQHPWLKTQDGAEKSFFDAWLRFASPALVGGKERFRLNFIHAYPTAGSSEAIRESIHQLACATPRGVVVVFNGEYEGYEALAVADGLAVLKLDRARWREELSALSNRLGTRPARFYLSQPSSIDGEAWTDFAAFLDAICEQLGAQMPVALDLAYVGASARLRPVAASHPAIQQVFFSLSKPFGVYYRRIGGVFSREAIPSLAGNQWFKNLDSLALGEKLLRAQAEPFALARGAGAAQTLAVSWISDALAGALETMGAEIAAASVPLLATLRPLKAADLDQWEIWAKQGAAAGLPGQLAKMARRGAEGRPAASWRLCLAPLISELLAEAGAGAASWLRDPQQLGLGQSWPISDAPGRAKELCAPTDPRIQWGLDGIDEDVMRPPRLAQDA